MPARGAAAAAPAARAPGRARPSPPRARTRRSRARAGRSRGRRGLAGRAPRRGSSGRGGSTKAPHAPRAPNHRQKRETPTFETVFQQSSVFATFFPKCQHFFETRIMRIQSPKKRIMQKDRKTMTQTWQKEKRLCRSNENPVAEEKQ